MTDETAATPAPPATSPSPDEVHQVLLLYSGGLDTSVMLKWIQDEYEAEVVALTINLGQPGEDYDVVEGKAIQLGAVAAEVVDAREEFARDYVAPGDQGQRDLRPRLPAVHGARPPADRQARRRLRARARLRHDRPRLHRQGQRPGADRGDGRDARAGAEGDRAGARLADGPRGGDRLRARARHPGQGRHRDAARTRSTTTSGAAPRRAAGSRTSTTRPRTTSSSSSRAPRRRPTRPQTVEVEFERGVPVALDGERLGLVELLERAAEIGCRHGVGIVDHIEDRIVGLKVRDIYEVPAAAILLPAHAELERLVGTIHQNQFKPSLDRQWAYLVYAGLWWEPLRERPRRLHGPVNERVTGTIGLKLYKGSVRVVTRASPERRLRRGARVVRRVRRAVLQQASPGLHRAVVAAVAHGLAPAQGVTEQD